MKVLAKVKQNTFICEVEETEMRKFLNTYYSHITKLEVGCDVDLAAGYDFASDARDAMKATQNLINSNKKIIDAIITGVKIFGITEGDKS